MTSVNQEKVIKALRSEIETLRETNKELNKRAETFLNNAPATFLRIDDVAQVCHEVNRAYCESLKDFTQPLWENAPSWQIESAIKGVLHHLQNPTSKPHDSHNAWLKEKTQNGWVYGVIKDADKKTHPCMVPFEQLPENQQAKDFIFLTIVRSLENFMSHVMPEPDNLLKEESGINSETDVDNQHEVEKI